MTCIVLELSAHVAQERVAGGVLCIVMRGLAIKKWRFMSAGKVRGAPKGSNGHPIALMSYDGPH